MKLPKPHFSFSQFSLWRKSKSTYRKRYFEGGEGFETKEMNFGKEFARILEEKDFFGRSDSEREVLLKITTLENQEVKIEHNLSGINILAFIDTAQKDFSIIGEYKTGKVEPDPTDQLKFYSLLILEKTGKIPQCFWEWAETEDDEENSIKFTGNFKKEHKISFTGGELQILKEEILKAAKEISEEYELFLGSKKENIQEELLYRYADLQKQLDILKADQDKIKEEIQKEFEENNVNNYKGEFGNFYFMERKKYIYPENFIQAEKDFKKLKTSVEKNCQFEISKSLAFRK